MVVSLVLGFLAMFVATMGMKCTRCGGDDKVKKARIAMTGGIVFIVAGEPLGFKVGPGTNGSLFHPEEHSQDLCLDTQHQNPFSLSRSCCLGSMLLDWSSDCHRLL